ncbi:MAG: hypothetical protein GVY19_03890 [Bacteroidetes bacterium]|jgi:protein involved in polysaccharide export with SLBB domain|nr:hypothetical protein [Bacteroidota bacterium]
MPAPISKTMVRQLLLAMVCLILPDITAFSQDIPSDLSNVKVEELSDDQVQKLIKRAEESGMTQQQMESAALARGLPPAELQKLRSRIQDIRSAGKTKMTSETRLREGLEISTRKELFGDLLAEKTDTISDKEGKKIFGRELFQSDQLTFEPSLNIPTPKNYMLGPGDEVVIDIWGASEANYQLEVTPDGYIFIDNLGPVYVSGHSIEKASALLKKRLTSIYSGLSGDNPNTFAQVTIGKIRSIKVNVIGEVTLPGSYTLPSLSSAFNALYLAGGPNKNGTLRNIKLIRDGEVFAIIDVYDYLIRGNSSVNKSLQDNDIILVEPYVNRIETDGKVKREAVYELQDEETLGELLEFTGGFSEKAYREMVKVERNTGTQKSFFDVSSDRYNAFTMQNGDKLVVESILNRFENRVQVEGAVFRPGYYELTKNLSVSELIDKAGGLREDAYLPYASLYRLDEENHISIMPISLSKIINGEDNITLKREDMLKIPSIFDIEEDYKVSIEGEVQQPGTYPYHKNITIQELIVEAGGLKESSSFSRVEIARRVVDKDAMAPRSEIAEVFNFGIDENLRIQDTDSTFILKPYDVVFIRKSPGYEEQKYISIQGEVAFPGKYALRHKNERISDIISRAGGLTTDAYIPGTRLVRKTVQDEERLRALEAIQQQTDEDTIQTEQLAKEKDLPIGIDLQKILENPHSDYDLILQEGDRLNIPKELQTVQASGALLYPVKMRYRQNKSTRYYINSSGGFAPNAKKSKVYVIYANGSVKRTHHLLGIKFYPGIEPGAEIVVPEKPEKDEISTQEALSITTAVSTLGLIIVRIIDTL